MDKATKPFAIITRLTVLLCLFGLSMPCYAKPKNDRTDIALRYIKSGIAPFEYIADKLRNHKVIAIGEDHWIADHSEFLCDVLRNVGFTEDTHQQSCFGIWQHVRPAARRHAGVRKNVE